MNKPKEPPKVHPSPIVRFFRTFVQANIDQYGYSHLGIVKRAGISRSGWYNWWRHPERDLSIERMEKVLEALGYSVELKLVRIEKPEETQKELRDGRRGS